MFTISRFIFAIIFLTLVPFVSSASEDRGKIIKGKVEGIQCYQFKDYYIIEKKRSTEPGSDFLIKFTQENGRDISTCEYSYKKGDFEIKDEFAAYFWMLKKNLLFLEHYTGPAPYVISIWNLKSRNKVFESTCNAPVTVLDTSLHFWLETGEATKENCTDLQQWESHGLGGGIETKVILNLLNMKLSETKETRCSIRQ